MTTRKQIVLRGIADRCPNCGAGTLFSAHSFRVNERCGECDTALNRGEGFFLGPMVINYTIAVFLFAVPCLALGMGELISWNVAMMLAVLSCTFVPVLLYRKSWSWWLMLYFYVLPERLPSNGGAVGEDEED